MTISLQLEVLTKGEIANIYDKCFDFLIRKGLQIDHPQLLQVLAQTGAKVDFDNKRVRFPPDIIEKALSNVPHNMTLAGKSKPYDVILPHPNGLFYARSNTGARSYIDADSNDCRDLTILDVEEWGQLTEVLDNIEACCFLTPRDVPVETADIHSLKAILQNTSKPVIVQPHSFESIEYLFKLAEIAAGGRNALKERPRIAMIACSHTPLAFKAMHVEAIIQAARYGVPVVAASLPSAGATSPITIVGTVLLAGIEILAMLIISQLLKPGLPVIGTINFYTLDMLDGRNLTASVDSMLGSAATTQFIKNAFHIPTHTLAFGTDSYIPDGQYMIETTLKGLIVSLSGADILGAAGRLNALSASNPIQLIIDDTIAGILKRIKSGLNVNDDTLGWQEITETEPGGHFLERAHTLKHCRDSLRIGLFVNQAWELWKLGGGKDLYIRALEKYRELKRVSLHKEKLDKDTLQEMSQIVKEADVRLAR